MIACSEAGLLPAKLDRDGMARALILLQQHLKTPAAPSHAAAPAPAPAPTASAAKKTSLSKDPRCIALAAALKPVLQGTCPQGAGGYGGALQANLHPADAEALGGVSLIRAALRQAARQLGWRVQTLGHEGERVVMVLVHDIREVPAEFADALEKERLTRGAEAMDRISVVTEGHAPREWGSSPVGRQTASFLAAAQAARAATPGAWA